MTKPELADLTQLKFSKSNPNVMTDEQMNSLGEFMQRVGFKIPVQCRTEDKEIIDGAHRVQWLLDHGITKGLVNWIDCTKQEARKYRIIFNELHGKLDQELYVQNLIEIQKAGELEDFALLMAKEEKEFLDAISSYEDSNFVPDAPIEEEIGTDEKFRITFEFTQIAEYERVLQTLKDYDENKERALLILMERSVEN